MIEYYPDVKPTRTPNPKGTMQAVYPVCVRPYNKHRRVWVWLWVCSKCGYEQVTISTGCSVHICPCQGGNGPQKWKRLTVGNDEWRNLGDEDRSYNLDNIKSGKYEDKLYPLPPAGKGSAQDYLGVDFG